jgi:hypothetical protein
MSGWFAVKRGITSHALFKGKPERLAVWLWLLDNAVWKDTTHDVKGHTVNVPRGSVCVSERHISEACGVGYQVVRTAIKRFKTEHMINAQPTHGKSMISLCNYEKYQDPKGEANAEVNATLTQRQRNPNAQKEQENKGTRLETTNVVLANAPPAIDEVAQAVSDYNAVAARVGWSSVQKLTPARRAAIKGRLKDAGGIEGWGIALGKAEASSFLRGERGDFRLTFDFLSKQTNFTKLMEGNYDDRTDKPTGGNSPQHSRADATTRAITIAATARRAPTIDCF